MRAEARPSEFQKYRFFWTTFYTWDEYRYTLYTRIERR